MELRTCLEGEPITRPITMSSQPSETVAAQGLSKVRASVDEGLAAGGLAERSRELFKNDCHQAFGLEITLVETGRGTSGPREVPRKSLEVPQKRS